MKARLLIAVAALMLFVNSSMATPKKNFEDALKGLNGIIKNYSSEKFYEKYEFTNKKTGETRKFSDFEEVNRFVFMLMRGELLSRELENVYNLWLAELKSAENMPDDEDEANKKQVEEYLEQLMNLRKKNALKLENLVESIFAKWPDQFTQEEKDHILKSIKEYNDKNQLIKRDK